MKTYTIEEITDKHIGKRGTPERDRFDFELKLDILGEMIKRVRKYTKIKTVLPDDQSALKAVFLAINNVQQKWTMPIQSWGIILNQFIIKFEDRCQV